MRLFGLDIRRTKAAVNPVSWPTTVTNLGGWRTILEPFAGAWQRNIEIRTESVLSFAAVYACVTLISSDIGKLRVKLVEQDADGIWQEITHDSPKAPVLRKPNSYQTRIQFFEHWMLSKLIHGNTYVLKDRDQRGIVTGLYVLDPLRCRAMVAPDGSVFYAVGQDNLAGAKDQSVVVPASEIIHDRMSALYHPLCGVSPISACGLAAMQGLRAQEHSATFFEHGAQPGGILTSPGIINDDDAAKMQREWQQGFSGVNYGRVAVLASGMTYQPLNMVNATDSQFIEQLKLSAEMVCTAYRVPSYKVGVGAAPSYNNVEALDQQYYGQCLQTHIESIELLLNEGLGLQPLGTEFDLNALMRMDTPSLMKSAADGIGSGGLAPNEARKRYLNLGPVKGGDIPYLQQQNYSLEALAKRDALADPFATAAPAAAEKPSADEPDDEPDTSERDVAVWREKAAHLELIYG